MDKNLTPIKISDLKSKIKFLKPLILEYYLLLFDSMVDTAVEERAKAIDSAQGFRKLRLKLFKPADKEKVTKEFNSDGSDYYYGNVKSYVDSNRAYAIKMLDKLESIVRVSKSQELVAYLDSDSRDFLDEWTEMFTCVYT